MRLLLIVILLLTVPQIHAQETSTSSADAFIEEELNASDSASPSATSVASPSAIKDIDQISTQSAEDQEVVLLDEPTTKTALIYTGIMSLVLIAFIAGKKSSELDRSGE